MTNREFFIKEYNTNRDKWLFADGKKKADGAQKILYMNHDLVKNYLSASGDEQMQSDILISEIGKLIHNNPSLVNSLLKKHGFAVTGNTVADVSDALHNSKAFAADIASNLVNEYFNASGKRKAKRAAKKGAKTIKKITKHQKKVKKKIAKGKSAKKINKAIGKMIKKDNKLVHKLLKKHGVVAKSESAAHTAEAVAIALNKNKNFAKDVAAQIKTSDPSAPAPEELTNQLGEEYGGSSGSDSAPEDTQSELMDEATSEEQPQDDQQQDDGSQEEQQDDSQSEDEGGDNEDSGDEGADGYYNADAKELLQSASQITSALGNIFGGKGKKKAVAAAAQQQLGNAVVEVKKDATPKSNMGLYIGIGVAVAVLVTGIVLVAKRS